MSATPAALARMRALAPEIVVLVAMLGYGSYAATFRWQSLGLLRDDGSVVALLLLTVAGVLFRASPGVALTLVWLAGVLQLVSGLPVGLSELVVLLVAYGTARHGSRQVLLAAVVSIPLAVACATALVMNGNLYFVDPTMDTLLAQGFVRIRPSAGLLLLALFALGVPWLVGLLLRTRSRAQASELATERAEEELHVAEELAEARAGQARLARDVHDVVGHSLAVVLAQAESAQFLPDDDTERIKATLANIATSARASLRDVRQVLASTADDGAAPTVPEGGLDSLVDGVRAAGREVISTVEGTPRPLPPELDVVAYRVLQEMLTNALRHGERAEPVFVERHWQGELRIEVHNVVAGATGVGEGQGLHGMRRRLEAVGGRLDVRPRDEDGSRTFTATAWVPTRATELGR